MEFVTKTIIYAAMILLSIVSMWTTYASLHDSILPEPSVRIHLMNDVVWDCSVFALGLSVAIGLMLFALKMAIIDEQKRLNIAGVMGMTIIAFISIAFNLDILYRTADRDFFRNYSTSRVKGAYEGYLSEAQTKLTAKKEGLLKQVAKQEGELDAEVKGLRALPEGYGRMAKQEDYELTLIQKTTAVELQTIDEALAKKKEVDALLASATPATLDEIEQLQHQLRVAVKDVGAAVGIPMPELVKLDNPLFAVFAKIFDLRTLGFKEVLLILIAFLLDLGDIIGYTLIPKGRKTKSRDMQSAGMPDFGRPALALTAPLPSAPDAPLELTDQSDSSQPTGEEEAAQQANASPRNFRRPFGFRHR